VTKNVDVIGKKTLRGSILGKQNDQPNWIDILSSYGAIKSIPHGEPVHFQGEKSKTIGFIISGTAKASIYSKQGQETWVGAFKEGDFFGYAELLTDTPIDFEIMTETDLQVLLIPAQKFTDILSSHDALATSMANDLAMRLKHMTNRLIEAVTLSSPGRVCAELLRLSKPVGVDPSKLIVRPNPVFIDLALRVNSTRETVSRTVNELQRSGILSRESGALLIAKPDTLRAKVK